MLRKIAFVDDSDLLHQMYGLVLRRYREQGTAVVGAHDGIEFLQLLGANPDIDLVLLDLNMPQMGGVETMTRLRASGRLASLKVILVSAHGGDEDLRRGLDLGAAAFVTKPFTAAELYARIEAIYGVKAGGRP